MQDVDLGEHRQLHRHSVVVVELRRALLAGVDEYERFSPLGGCENDVRRLVPLLRAHEDGSPNFECRTMFGARRDDLLEGVKELLRPGADLALLFFAGHGEGEGSDVALCTADGTEHTPGIPFTQILGMVVQSDIPEVVVMLDCCFAGAAGEVPAIGGDASVLRNGVSILAASRGDQTSAETLTGGLYTLHLAGALEGGAADVLGNITLAGLYAYVSESFGPWSQRPTFKANVDRLHDIRRCDPALPLAELRLLPDLFPTFQSEYQLDPTYEPEVEPKGHSNEATFAVLQRYRDAKLLRPVNQPHMYATAMNSGTVKLTLLGQHYWRLAKEGRF